MTGQGTAVRPPLRDADSIVLKGAVDARPTGSKLDTSGCGIPVDILDSRLVLFTHVCYFGAQVPTAAVVSLVGEASATANACQQTLEKRLTLMEGRTPFEHWLASASCTWMRAASIPWHCRRRQDFFHEFQ